MELSRERVALVGGESHPPRTCAHAVRREQELGDVMELIDNTLSEPCSIFYIFINTWPTLCILTRSYPIPGEEDSAGTEPAGKLIGGIV